MDFEEKLKLELKTGVENEVLRPMFEINGFRPFCAELKERFFNNLERLDEEFPPDKGGWKQLGENLALHKPEYLEKYKDCFKGVHWLFIVRMLNQCNPEYLKNIKRIIPEYIENNKDKFKVEDWFYIIRLVIKINLDYLIDVIEILKTKPEFYKDFIQVFVNKIVSFESHNWTRKNLYDENKEYKKQYQIFKLYENVLENPSNYPFHKE